MLGIPLFAKRYINEKAKNLASKEDIRAITSEAESVKSDFIKSLKLHEQKEKLKHDACIEALEIIDAKFSQILKLPESDKVKTKLKPVYISSEKVRSCHNRLILACDNPKVVSYFVTTLLTLDSVKQPTDLIYSFRNIVRVELGFGKELEFKSGSKWIAAATEKQEENS